MKAKDIKCIVVVGAGPARRFRDRGRYLGGRGIGTGAPTRRNADDGADRGNLSSARVHPGRRKAASADRIHESIRFDRLRARFEWVVRRRVGKDPQCPEGKSS